MKEAKDFKKDELIKLIDEAIEKEKKYQDWGKDISPKSVESARAIREGSAWDFHCYLCFRAWRVLGSLLDYHRIPKRVNYGQ